MEPHQERPDWRDVLRNAGYPADVVVVDFETYFDDEISMRGDRLSTIEYVTHPEFESLGVSVLTMPADAPDKDYEAGCHWFNGEAGVTEVLRNLRHVYGPNLDRCTVVAHNAQFDGAVLAFRHDIRPPYFIDTLGLARHWDARNRNDLDSLTERLGLTGKGDTQQFKGWTNHERVERATGRKAGPPRRRPRMTEQQQAELGKYANNDTAREWEVFRHLLPRMSNPRTELRVMQHTLGLFFNPVLDVDGEMAERLKTAMLAEVKHAVDPTGLSEKEIRGGAWDDAMANALTDAGEVAGEFIKPAGNCKRGWKIASADGDPTREILENHADDSVRGLMAAKAAIGSWPNHIRRIDRIVAQARAAGGKLPVPLKYHGAITGRWSGGEKINLQNLGSRGHELVSAIREMLAAPEGCELVIADASQIEARVLAWVAGQWDLVEKFAAGEEIYCGFAERVLGYPVRKPRAGGIPAIEAKMKWARNSIGKVGVLGCLARDTPVLTDGGWKPIQRVAAGDRVWDGEAFVRHEGAVYQGVKTCVEVCGVWMTEDHEVYRGGEWSPAVRQSTSSLGSAACTEDSRWSPLSLGREAGLSVSNVAASAVEQLTRSETTWSAGNLHAAIRALKLRLHGPTHTQLTARNLTAADFLVAFVRSSGGAKLAPSRVTADVESDVTLTGSRTERHFSDTFRRLTGGMTPHWKSTGSTTTETTSRATYGSPREARTCETWDIIRAGSNRRFQAGPLMVANCGYGLGPAKAVSYAQGAIDPATAEKLVATYREDNAEIVKFWRDIEECFVYTARYKKPCELPRGLKFRSTDDCDVAVTLPNGRELKYHRVRVEQGRYGYGPEAAVYNALKQQWLHVWGGHLTENVVQAISRDILWDAISRLEDRGHHVALHVHDELIAVVPEGRGAEVLDLAIRYLSERPEWGARLPLAAEGVVSPRYGGH